MAASTVRKTTHNFKPWKRSDNKDFRLYFCYSISMDGFAPNTPQSQSSLLISTINNIAAKRTVKACSIVKKSTKSLILSTVRCVPNLG